MDKATLTSGPADPSMSLRRRRLASERTHLLRNWLICCGVVAVLIAVLSPTALLSPLSTAAAYAVVVLTLDLTLGFGGMLALGQGALWGVSAYVFAILSNDGLGFWLSAVAGIAAAGLIAVILIPLLRLRWLYFALATLVLGLIFEGVANALVNVTGGPTGISVSAPYQVGGLIATDVLTQCIIGWVVALLVLGAVLRLQRSRFGQGLQAARDDELAASSFGVQVFRTRAKTWVFAGVLTGVSGVMFAVVSGYLTPAQFSLAPSVLLILMLVLGGEASGFGSLIGAVVIVLLPNVLSGIQQYATLLYAALILIVVVLIPEGLFGLFGRVATLLRRRFATTLAAPPTRTERWRAERPPRTRPVASDRVVLRAHGVGKSFAGIRALDSVDVEIRQGEVFGIIGPNGAGKTTFLNCLSGVDQPDEGDITIYDTGIRGLRPDQIATKGLSRTFQNIRLFGTATVRTNVRGGGYGASGSGLVAGLLGLPSARRDLERMDERADRALQILGLEHLASRPVAQLTTGQQRLAEVGRSIAADSSIILLDEPAAGLSEQEAEHLLDVIEALRESGRTVVLIEHNVDFIMRLCDRILVLHLGRRIALGTPSEIRRDEGVVDAYLGQEQ